MKVTQWASLLLPLATGLGLLHSFGYWGKFGINPLEFVGVADLAKLSVKPLANLVLLLLVGGVIGGLLGEAPFVRSAPGGTNDGEAELDPEKPAALHSRVMSVGGRIERLVLRWRRWLVGLLAFAALATYSLAQSAAGLYVVGVLLSILLWVLPAHWLQRLPLWASWEVDPFAKRTVLFLFTAYSGVIFAAARSDAETAQLGENVPTVDMGRSDVGLEDPLSGAVVYLGRLSDTYVLLEHASGQVVLVNASEARSLFLTPGRRKESMLATASGLTEIQTDLSEVDPSEPKEEDPQSATPLPPPSEPPLDEPR